MKDNELLKDIGEFCANIELDIQKNVGWIECYRVNEKIQKVMLLTKQLSFAEILECCNYEIWSEVSFLALALSIYHVVPRGWPSGMKRERPGFKPKHKRRKLTLGDFFPST